MSSLDSMLVQAFGAFEAWLLESGWTGKENDCVNLFAHGFLFPLIGPGAAVTDFTQVCIEVGVPQPPGWGTKPSCRRDLVIWDAPRAVAWSPTWEPVRRPAAIVEWKARQDRLDEYDVGWLKAYARRYPGFLGYAVTVDFAARDRRLIVARVTGEAVDLDVHKRFAGPAR
jgi:hypothetical protein